MNKQIEEMARTVCDIYTGNGKCDDCEDCDFDCWAYRVAERLYNAGYRKRSEINELEEISLFNRRNNLN